MPNRLVRVLASAFGALALTACGLIGAENKAAEVMPSPTISLTAAGPEGCNILLNGAPVTQTALRDDLTTRMASWRRAMAGYLVNTDIPNPFPKLDAPADMRFACVGRVLATIADAEMPTIEFGRTGDGARVNVAVMQTVSSTTDLLTLAADGSMTFNGEPIDAAGIRRLVESVGTAQSLPQPRVVAPAAEATVGQIHEVLYLLRMSAPTLAPPGAVSDAPLLN